MLRVAVSRALERGLPLGGLARGISGGAAGPWARALVRSLHAPLPTVCVAGSTLGGSGATPVAIALARALADAGARVALVGHAYRAAPGRARWVRPDDALAEVGDEALLAARHLGDVARVVVAPSRQAAIDHARACDVLVLDGILSLRAPAAPSRTVLVVDAARPWGSGLCPPFGDLRAPRRALLARADRVLTLGDAGEVLLLGGVSPAVPVEPMPRTFELAALPRGARVGLVTCLARPDRVLRTLQAMGIHVAGHLRGADHGPAPRPSGRADVWVATEKCAIHLDASRAWDSVPRVTLKQHLAPPGSALAGFAGLA